jgi:TonB family protein
MISALAIAAAIVATAQTQPAQPKGSLTPGAVVLLANGAAPEDSQTLRRALTDPNPDVRRAAARVASVAHPEVIEALRHALETEDDPSVAVELVKDVMAVGGAQAEAFVTPYARKAGAGGVAAIAEWFARMDPAGLAARLAGWSDLRGAERSLVRIVRLAILCHPEARDAIVRAWTPIASPAALKFVERRPEKHEGESTLQTPPPLPAHLLGDTLAASGCPSDNIFNGALIEFAPDGRPRTVDVPDTLVRGGCLAALAAIARISTADPNDPARHPHEVVLPMWKDFLACASGPYEEPLFPFEGSYEGIRSPRLVKEVKPDYNRDGMQQKLEGVVEMEGVVSERGCVRSMRVLQGLGVLDIQAIKAALRWKFEPALAGDRPVPFTINIELTFRLR